MTKIKRAKYHMAKSATCSRYCRHVHQVGLGLGLGLAKQCIVRATLIGNRLIYKHINKPILLPICPVLLHPADTRIRFNGPVSSFTRVGRSPPLTFSTTQHDPWRPPV